MKMDLVEVLMRLESGLIMLVVCGVPMGFVRVMPQAKDSATYARLAPLIPIVLAELLVWVPGLRPMDLSVSATALLGIVLGAFSSVFYKVFRQTLLGQDARIVGGVGVTLAVPETASSANAAPIAPDEAEPSPVEPPPP